MEVSTCAQIAIIEYTRVRAYVKHSAMQFNY